MKAAPNREAWLTNLAERIVPRVESIVGKRMPNFKITMGFPSRNALSMRKRRIGECWDKIVCVDGTHQIFITPLYADSLAVSGIVGHELIHAMIGTKFGHGKEFTAVMRPLGLVGRATATEIGPEYKRFVDPILNKLGPYPHSPMTISTTHKKAPTRMLKAECPKCDYKVRITQMWVDAPGYGPPICPYHFIPMRMEKA